MIVDDAAFMRGSLRFIIEKAGHEMVSEARSGKEAVNIYRAAKPDVVTLDILMKDGDGISALQDILAQDSQARVIMVTALGQETKEQEARQLGAIGYIRKPFRKEEITSEIDRVMGLQPRAGN